MRLVDADALCAMSWKRDGGEEYAKGFRHGVGFVMNEIEKAPTIDAIPVEWLDDRANDITRAPLYRRYVQMLMDEWQKEQEAR